jgi:hypothetical protein
MFNFEINIFTIVSFREYEMLLNYKIKLGFITHNISNNDNNNITSAHRVCLLVGLVKKKMFWLLS